MLEKFQSFFYNNPVIAGLILFAAIAVFITILIIIVLLVKKWTGRNKKTKTKSEKPAIDIEEMKNEIVEEETKNDFVLDPSFNYYFINYDTKSCLFIQNAEGDIINNDPSKNDFISILTNENEKLMLPENYIEIKKNQSNDSEELFITTQPVQDTNLFTFNLFLRFMKEVEMPWAISKFK